MRVHYFLGLHSAMHGVEDEKGLKASASSSGHLLGAMGAMGGAFRKTNKAQHVESLNYETSDNEVFLAEQASRPAWHNLIHTTVKWTLCLLTGEWENCTISYSCHHTIYPIQCYNSV